MAGCVNPIKGGSGSYAVPLLLQMMMSHSPPVVVRTRGPPTRSIFTITQKEASANVAQWNIDRKQLINNNNEGEADLACYMMYVTVRPVYADAQIPHTCFKKLPRLINGIPLGAGKLTKAESQNIHWKFIEGTTNFLSIPITREEANTGRKNLRDNLMRYGKEVFGEVTVKLNIILTECIKYDEELFINDIAYSSDEGLHFTD